MARRPMLRISVAVLAAVVVAAATVGALRRAYARHLETERLVGEVVNDHLRILVAGRPAELESADGGQVQAWLMARLGFAPGSPTVPSSPLELRGASLGYVLDRKAAVLLYRLRLHRLTLLVFPAAELAWPSGASGAGPPLSRVNERGFHVVLWRARDLGYALVSDSNPDELALLAERLAAPSEAGR